MYNSTTRDGTTTGALPSGIKDMCKQTDQASAALSYGFKAKGLAQGYTWLSGAGNLEGPITARENSTKRILAVTTTPDVFPLWMAGGGVKPGYAHGQTDEYSYNVVNDGVHVHDFHATLLHSAWHRSRASHLQIPGPLLPPDRCSWARRQARPCLAKNLPATSLFLAFLPRLPGFGSKPNARS